MDDVQRHQEGLMMKQFLPRASRSLVFLAGAFSSLAFAENVNVIGVWNLLSITAEDVQTHRIYPVAGKSPMGHIIYTPNGYMSVLFTSSGRAPIVPESSHRTEEATQLFGTLTAYTGPYSVDDKTITHHVDVAADPGLVGTEQIRHARLVGDTLILRTPPMPGPDHKEYEIEATWIRTK
jgi:hypothetical protein